MSAARTLRENGLRFSDSGLAALSGTLLQCAENIDNRFVALASKLRAIPYRFPSMIAASDLAPIGYLGSFPHLATFACCGRKDALPVLATDFSRADSIPASSDLLDDSSYLLTPAACYHFYPAHAGVNLAHPKIMTTRCQCHRREDEYLPLQRQWCFEMREIVCLGDAPAIESFVGDCRALVDQLADDLGLSTSWQLATDPFFDPRSDPKALAQKLEPTKLELRTPGGLAIASINRHRGFFGESYDIFHRGIPAQSACVALGIERWLFATLERDL